MTQLQGCDTGPAVVDGAKSGAGLSRTSRRVLMGVALALSLVAYLALLASGWWLVDRFVPTATTLHLFGHSHQVANLRQKILTNLALALTVLPAALWIEMLHLGWRESSLRRILLARTPSMKTDLAVFVLGQAHVLDFVGKLMMLGVSMISGMWVHDWLKAQLGINFELSALPVAAQVLAYFYVYTFFDYWTHRFNHSHWFWPLHRYHHSAEEFYVVTADRQHPAAFTGILMINVPMAVLGASPQVMLWVNILVNVIGYLIHSRIDADWGWAGRWLVQSPNHHRLHHKLDMTHPTGHFSMAPVWDRLFATWYGDADQSLTIGVDTPYRHGAFIAPDLVRDYWHFWRGLPTAPPPKPVYAAKAPGPR